MDEPKQPGEGLPADLPEERPDQDKADFDEAWQPRLWSKLILLVLMVGYGIGLVVANSDEVEVSFLFKKIDVSKVWLILLCFVIGLASGVLASQMYRHRKIQRARLKLEEQAK